MGVERIFFLFYNVLAMNLKAEIRNLSEKPKSLRAEGFVLAEVYGGKEENQHLKIKIDDFKGIFKEAGENTVLELDIEGKKTPVLIYDVDQDVLDETFRNVDFYRVDMTKKVEASIPLVFEGEATAVKQKNGILVCVLHEVEVESLPNNLPHEIKIDLSVLDEVGKNIHVNDIKLPEGVEMISDKEAVVATIKEQKQEKVEEPTDVTKVEVEGEKKEEEGDKKEESK